MSAHIKQFCYVKILESKTVNKSRMDESLKHKQIIYLSRKKIQKLKPWKS